jgi:uncharacterized protein (DUF1810 family)
MADCSSFLAAQNAGHPSAYDRALAELHAGHKCSHWIWFVLPQLQGLGRSAMAQRYSINGPAEANAYLDDPTFRNHLEEVIAVRGDQLQKPGQSLALLMGRDLDATQTISCLTLFEAACLSHAK